MAERKELQDVFLRMYNLSSFKAFNPKFKEECLTGNEMMLFLKIVKERLLYIRKDEKAWNGNTIKVDKEYREKVLEELGVGQGCYEHMLTKLIKGGILYKIRNGYYLMNPYCFAKGNEALVKYARNMGIFRNSTINFEKGFSPYVKDPKTAPKREKKEADIIKPDFGNVDGIYEEDGELFVAEERIVSDEKEKTEENKIKTKNSTLRNRFF